MEKLSDQGATHGLTPGEIFDLYCRLLALDQRLREIDAMAAEIRPPFDETDPGETGASADALSLAAFDSAPAQSPALG